MDRLLGPPIAAYTSMSAVCAFALVLDDQSRLLLCRRRKDGKWNLPGGQCEAGESPWRTVTREVLEELALQVRVEQLRGVYSVPRLDHVVLTFICERCTSVIRPAAEIGEVGWFERGNLLGNMREYHEGRAVDAFGEETLVMRVDT